MLMPSRCLSLLVHAYRPPDSLPDTHSEPSPPHTSPSLLPQTMPDNQIFKVSFIPSLSLPAAAHLHPPRPPTAAYPCMKCASYSPPCSTDPHLLHACRMCKGVAVMRRRSDSWLNATQILKVAGFDKPQRTRVLEREVQKGEHGKVQGGYGKYQGESASSSAAPDFIFPQGLGYRSSVASPLRGSTTVKPPCVPLLNSSPRPRALPSRQNTSCPRPPSHDPLVAPQSPPRNQPLPPPDLVHAVSPMPKRTRSRKSSPNLAQRTAL